MGVFRDVSGNTPILECVRRAERDVLAAQTTKSYVGAAGRDEFNAAVEELVLGVAHPARASGARAPCRRRAAAAPYAWGPN